MKHKYIGLGTMMACLPKPAVSAKKDIHQEIEETLAERKRIIKELVQISRRAKVIDMYLQAAQTA